VTSSAAEPDPAALGLVAEPADPRISPIDPTGPYAAALYREAARTRSAATTCTVANPTS
jgi:hypothetical protein